MTAIWAEENGSWALLGPTGFPNEASLHEIVTRSPELLPLSGSPSLTVIGREVLLGSGYADVVAIESTGRPVVIEVKLRNNTESRRAVVAQVLAYASALFGLTRQELEREVLARHLRGRTLLDVVRESETTQEGVDPEAFADELARSLRGGGFRLVLVLDEVPDELVTLVGYLESVTETLTVDLVTVTAYELDGRRIVVPQLVTPEPSRPATEDVLEDQRAAGPARRGQQILGVQGFEEAIENAPAEFRPDLRRLSALGRRIESEALAEVYTYFGKRGEVTLLPRLRPDCPVSAASRQPTPPPSAVQRGPSDLLAMDGRASLRDTLANRLRTKGPQQHHPLRAGSCASTTWPRQRSHSNHRRPDRSHLPCLPRSIGT